MAAPLIGLYELPLDPLLRPRGPLPGPQAMAAMLSVPVDLARAAVARAVAGETAAWAAALELMEAAGLPEEQISACREACVDELERTRAALAQQRGELNSRLERLRWLDLLGEDQSREVEARLGAVEGNAERDPIEARVQLGAADAILSVAEEGFAVRSSERLGRLRAGGRQDARSLDAVAGAIAARNFEQAEEMLGRLERGDPLPQLEAAALPLLEVYEFYRKGRPGWQQRRHVAADRGGSTHPRHLGAGPRQGRLCCNRGCPDPPFPRFRIRKN